MRHLWIVAVSLVAACAGKKDEDNPPTPAPRPMPTPVDAAPPIDAAPDPACIAKTDELKQWLENLAADGHETVTVTGMTLVKLDQAPSQLPDGAIYVTIKPTELVIDGTLVGNPGKPTINYGKTFLERLEAHKPAGDVALVIDAKTRWAGIAPLVQAVSDSHQTVTLVFEAGAPSHASKPPPSSIDAELDKLAAPRDPAAPAPDLSAPKDPITVRVFDNCPDVGLLSSKLADKPAAERDRGLVEGLPKAILACGCKVELPAVQRLMWAWWGRDGGPPLTGVTVAIAKTGTKVRAKPTATWLDAHKAILDAAKAGKPIAVQ
ncbi:MAG TPA: hypothetical protein VFQ53_11350 [Kofleriaceae bacterium]|nr:hypothetical protein [Kofleriaceae bacterium]